MADTLNKYEKETILRTSEGDDTYDIYTYNTSLKRRLAEFAEKYPNLIKLDLVDGDAVSYTVDKSRISIRLNPPMSEERKAEMRERAKTFGFKSKA